MSNGYIYLLKVPHGTNSPMYKVGQTWNLSQRLRAYPSGSTLIMCMHVSNVNLAEKKALQELHKVCTLCQGREYFTGDLPDAVNAVLQGVQQYRTDLSSSQALHCSSNPVEKTYPKNTILSEELKCARCDYTTSYKANLVHHLQRKTRCDPL